MTVLKSAFFAITFMVAGSVAAPQMYESFRQLYDECCDLTGSEEPVVEYQGIFFNVVGQTTLNEVGVTSAIGMTKNLLLIELQDRRGDPNSWTDSFRSFDSRFKRPA